MTALQDWLNSGPVTPHHVKSLVFGVLRLGPQPTVYRRAPEIMQRGLERC
ncbi:hypothetical protein [Mycolicibacterium diernhoferi]|nr:hypothetical protein [Mycolicibacterium diernhoferi]QYL25138.1 hypothetical protein K0O62_13345 [Mycolicibacterium diernhoferi]